MDKVNSSPAVARNGKSDIVYKSVIVEESNAAHESEELETKKHKMEQYEMPFPKRRECVSPEGCVLARETAAVRIWPWLSKAEGNAVVAGQFSDMFVRLSVGLSSQPKRTALPSALPVDIWEEILEFLCNPKDMLSLACTSSALYERAMPRLLRTIAIRSPLEYSSPEPGVSTWHNLIPVDVLVDKFTNTNSKLYTMGRFVKHLTIPKWEPRGHRLPASNTPSHFQQAALPVPLFLHELRWRGLPPLEIILANALENNMRNLQSFSYIPLKYNVKRPATELPFRSRHAKWNYFMQRGYSGSWKTPALSAVVLSALKELPLRNLTVDFEDWDPLTLDRIRNNNVINSILMPAQPEKYDGKVHGLIGFQHLTHLDVRGVRTDERFNEIATVVADCLSSACLRKFNISVESWLYHHIQYHRQINAEKNLLYWIGDISNRCLRIAKTRHRNKQSSIVPLEVTATFGFLRWTFEAPLSYEFSTENMTALSLTLCPQPQICGLLDILSEHGLPSLRIFAVEAPLRKVDRILRVLSGLMELYIHKPNIRYAEIARESDFLKKAIKTPMDFEALKPNATVTNLIMETISTRHLPTLTILVVDAMVNLPTNAFCNNIVKWRRNGGRLRELGISPWGPRPLLKALITSFPRLKSLWLFNPHRPDAVLPLDGMPPTMRYSPEEELFFGAYFCNASYTAAFVANVWAREVLEGGWDKLDGIPAERWIAVGPHYITSYSNWRWLWKEDNAASYRGYFEKMRDFRGLCTQNILWEGCGKMFRTLRERREHEYADPFG